MTVAKTTLNTIPATDGEIENVHTANSYIVVNLIGQSMLQ